MAAPESGQATTLLLVDDNEDVRELLVRTLEAAGYATLAAAGYVEATQAFAALQNGIQLLVTDMGLPDGTGLELARQLQRVSGGLSVLVMSGMPLPERELGPNIYFIAKPFTSTELISKVVEALSSVPQSRM